MPGGKKAGQPCTPRPGVSLCFCLRNVDFSTRDWLQEKLGAKGVGCLGKCSLCFQEPFLEVNGRSLTGSDHATIVRRHLPAAHQPGAPAGDPSTKQIDQTHISPTEPAPPSPPHDGAAPA